jgi:DNA repair exonuclease SbcCD ATPase subunit
MCHENLKIDVTAPVAFVLGANGAGKTAIRDALEFVYLGTGLLRGIATKKELGALSVTESASRCCVTIRTERMQISRSMKRDGSQQLSRQERPSGDATWGEAKLVAPRRDGKSPLTGIAGDALRAILDPTGFYRMDATRRREILIQSTSSKSTRDEILEALRAALEPESDADERALQTAAAWADEDGFRHAEEQAGEARRRAKREASEITLTPPADDPGFRDNDIQSFEARLEEVRQLHVKAVANEASSAAALEGQLTEAQAAQDAAEGVDQGSRDAGAAEALKAATECSEAALKTAEQAQGAAQVISEELQALEARSGDGGPPPDPPEFARPGKCPGVDFEYTCPVKTATFVKHRVGARRAMRDAPQVTAAAIAEVQTRLDAAREARDGAETALTMTIDGAEAAQARSTAESERQARADAAEAAITRTRARVQELEGQILEARQASQEQAARESQGSPAETAAELAERIERGTMMVARKRAWDSIRNVHDVAELKLQSLGAQAARWDAIAKALKPDGIETKLGGDGRERFLALLADAEGIAGSIDLTETFEITVNRDGKLRHPLQLSTSQQLGVGMAIQHALAQLVEFPLLCCDAIDTFDGATRRAWSAFALSVSERYAGGVIGLATLTAAPPGQPPEGFETFWIMPSGAVEHLVGVSE